VSTSDFDAWNWRDDSGMPAQQDIIGYHVEAIDGKIGKVTELHTGPGAGFLIVDTGAWIFGRSAMLPAGVVTYVDHEDRMVYVVCSKQEIKDSPEVDPAHYTDEGQRAQVANHYAGATING
jgi:hypothetical protein